MITATPHSVGPWRRAWQRFCSNRRGYISLWLFGILFVLSLAAELLSNDRPLLIYYHGQIYTPLLHDYSERVFGGDFQTPADYLDPFIKQRLTQRDVQEDNWAIYPLNHYSFNTLNYFATRPNPAPPSSENWLGTDDRGRDILARVLYGFRVSVLFAFALTAVGLIVGILFGALQGYFAGRTDLIAQRVIEVWISLPELYLLLILASLFEPSIFILLIILSLFSWVGFSDYVRAEFLRNRNLDYVRAARAMGLTNWQIMWRHVLPNSLTPVVTLLPFKVSGAILALTSLDFLGLGVPSTTPSLGELLAQGKDNLDAWWIGLSAFGILVMSLVLLVFIGDALRDALDPRKQNKSKKNGKKIIGRKHGFADNKQFIS